MAQSVGYVKSLNGYVISRSPDGTEQQLAIGDRVDLNDIIVTSPGSNIVISLDNGEEIHLDSTQELALDDTLLNDADLSGS